MTPLQPFVAPAADPVIPERSITAGHIDEDAITDFHVSKGHVDGGPEAPSLRTLGQGPQQACAGDDYRLRDERVPCGEAGGILVGTYPNPTGLAAFTPVQGPLYLMNVAEENVPTPVGGGAFLFSDGGALKFKGGNGTVTVVAEA